MCTALSMEWVVTNAFLAPSLPHVPLSPNEGHCGEGGTTRQAAWGRGPLISAQVPCACAPGVPPFWPLVSSCAEQRRTEQLTGAGCPGRGAAGLLGGELSPQGLAHIRSPKFHFLVYKMDSLSHQGSHLPRALLSLPWSGEPPGPPWPHVLRTQALHPRKNAHVQASRQGASGPPPPSRLLSEARRGRRRKKGEIVLEQNRPAGQWQGPQHPQGHIRILPAPGLRRGRPGCWRRTATARVPCCNHMSGQAGGCF